jgi:protein phosphatase
LKIDTYNIIVGNATDIGQIREINEDYMAHFETPYGYCIIVCDGMGGHAAGDIASQGAIDAIKRYLQDGKVTMLDTPNSLQNAIEFANYKLREMVKQNSSLSGMGTTCILALFQKAEMYMAHAGDSRLYLIRKNSIKQLSKDHSTVQNLIDAGVLSESEALLSEKRNQITKAIGIFDKVEPSVTKEAMGLKQGDKILLCSDGLTAHVTNSEILEIVNTYSDVQEAALKLIEKANSGGGSDNITVQLIQYNGKSFRNRNKKRRNKRLRLVFLTLISVVLAYFAIQKWGPLYIKKTTQNETFKSDSIKSSVIDDSLIIFEKE